MSVTKDVSNAQSSGIVAASFMLHLALLLCLAHRSRVWVAPVHLPGSAHGRRMVLTYLPGPPPSAASAIAHATKPQKPVRSRMNPLPAPSLANAKPVATPEPMRQDPCSGADALGDGDISIALMQFFPDPKPDLSRLPHGSRGDVVLEAVIDAGGRIVQLTVKQGLGYGVDESVIATVEQWTFHPAMRDGRPVASQQEFHFHYERG